MQSSGKLVVLSIFAVAIALAGFAWLWNRNAGEKSLHFWGKQRALIIRDAKKVQLFEVLPLDATPQAGAGVVIVKHPNLGQFMLQLDKTQDISGAPGLVHARHSLLQDHSFGWASEDQPPQVTPPPPRCTHAVRFTSGQGTVTILFDFSDQRLYCVESQERIVMASKTGSGWLSYVKRNRSTAQSP